MASRLIGDMTEEWKPEKYKDSFREDLMVAIRKKVKAGKTHELTEPDKEASGEKRESATVIDLVSLLKQSMGGKGKRKTAVTVEEESAPDKSRTRKTASATTKVAKRTIGGAVATKKKAVARKAATPRKAA